MVSALLVGLTLGLIAKYWIEGNYSSNFVVPVGLGIAGAMFAHYLGIKNSWYQVGEPLENIIPVVGSVIVLVLYKLIHMNSPSTGAQLKR